MRPLVVWALVLVVMVMVALGGCTCADWAGYRHDSHRYFEHQSRPPATGHALIGGALSP